jgi:hypothetical protein
LLNDLLAKDPDNPQFLNAKAIVLDAISVPGEARRRDATKVKDLSAFRRAFVH